MPRPTRCRNISTLPDYWSLEPVEAEEPATLSLTLDELETVRLIDLEGQTQEECALGPACGLGAPRSACS